VTEDDLTKLGLTGCVLGETTTIEWPEPEDTALGKGVAAGVTLAMALEAGSFSPVHLARLDDLGVAIEYSTRVRGGVSVPDRVVKILGPPDEQFEIYPSGITADPNAYLRDTEDPNTFVIDHARAPVVALVFHDGNLILLEHEPGRHRVTTGFRVPALEEINPPAEVWQAASGVVEPWLREQVEQHQQMKSSWHNLVAAGLVARLATSSETGRTPSVIQEDLARPRRWALTLNANQLRTVELLLQAETLRLLADLKDLQRTFECDDPGWQDDLLALCRARDDIEGIRILLNEAHAFERTASVQVLDQEAMLFMSSLPVTPRLDDERLRVVARFDPDAWWASVVTESSR
jgi:hypothetical protein